MGKKTIVIWGAGKIGRGVVADMFSEAGYRLILVRRSSGFVSKLCQAGHYTVVRAHSDGRREARVIRGYRALTTAQSEELAEEVVNADLVCVTVQPQDLAEVARQLAPCILARRRHRASASLGILVCANMVSVGKKFRSLLEDRLPNAVRDYFDERIGVVETLSRRAAVNPPSELLRNDPLQVWISGEPRLVADRAAFKGAIPDLSHFELVDNIEGLSAHKMFFGNMVHSLVAYHGALWGYRLMRESISDQRILAEAEGALGESSRSLQAQYDLAPEVMSHYKDRLFRQMRSSALDDTVRRVGGNPLRKLGRDDRLVGAALLARKHGIATPHLSRAVAAALMFDPGDDPAASSIQRLVRESGLQAAIQEVCGLGHEEGDVVENIVQAHHQLCSENPWTKGRI